jgi:integrase/recombinase XerD
VTHPEQVTRQHLERYQHFLFTFRSNANGQHERPLTIRSQHARLWATVRFFRWAHRTGRCPTNPADIELPRLPRPLPRPALTSAEVERVLAMPVLTTADGLRDRTMLEVLYATGMRRGELCSLRVEDIDHGREVVNIREGKGRKGRVVPISRRALAWVARYVAEVWARFPKANEHRLLFVLVDNTKHRGLQGMPLSAANVTRLLGGYLIAAGIDKAGACHIYRRTAATLMMENGADIRAIQDLLGHSEIKTVGIYTNVSLKFLKEQHAKTHPSAMPAAVPPPSAGGPG